MSATGRSRGKVLALAVGLAAAAPAPVMGDENKSLTQQILDRISLQQIVKDKNSINKPALFSLTLPKQGAAQKDVSVALTIDLLTRPEFTLGPSLEFQEKTGISQPQSLFKVGAQSSWLPHFGPVERPSVFVGVDSELNYKKDGKARTRGLSGAVRFTASAPRSVCRFCPDLDFPVESAMQFRWLPKIGIEFDDAIKGAADQPKGGVWRTYEELEVGVYPLATLLGKRLVLSAALSHRRDLATPNHVARRNHYYRLYSASIGLDPYQIFSFGVDRVSGEDPATGLKAQRFVRVSLRAQIGKSQRDLYRKATKKP